MEDLLVGRVRRTTNDPVVRRASEIRDVRQHHVGRSTVDLGILAAAEGRDVRGEAGVDGDVILAAVRFHADAAEDEEAVAGVELAG